MLSLTVKPMDPTTFTLPNGDVISIKFDHMPQSRRIRLFIDAPRNVQIVRADAIKREPRKSASGISEASA